MRLNPVVGHKVLVGFVKITRPNAIILLCLLGILPSSAAAKGCPAVPPLPVPSSDDLTFRESWQGVAEPYSIEYTMRDGKEPPYGVGYLRVINSTDYYYDWPRSIVFPLWNGPDEDDFYGWLHSGRVHPDNGSLPYALSGVGMVETDYEHSTFIVWETRDIGWLRIRLRTEENGFAWTHQCHITLGDAKLDYEGWESFMKQHGDWLHFRAQVPHSLRERPDINSPRISVIGLNHKIELSEIDGDWMRVRVSQPDWTCTGLDIEEFNGSIHEGWVKWRDKKQGPWVWAYTRGC